MSAAADTRRSVMGTAAGSCCRNRSFEHSVAGQRPARHLDFRPMTGPVTCELTLSLQSRRSSKRLKCLQRVDSGCCQALTVWPVSSVARSLDWRTIDSASELDLAWRKVQRVPLWSVRFRVAGRIGQQAVPPPVLLA